MRPFANLRTFLEFWVDERSQHACAALATDDELETDPEAYDCGDDCPVAAALDALWPENADAWRVFHQVVSRFTVEFHLGGEALRRLTGELEADAFEALLERLSLIYDLLYPPRQSGPAEG
jgi:hypothetical protein